MSTNTPRYGWVLPDVGGDEDQWGAKLNSIFTNGPGAPLGIDERLFELQTIVRGDPVLAAPAAGSSVQKVAEAALPRAGGQMTGAVQTHSGTIKVVEFTNVSGAVHCDLAQGNWFRIKPNGAINIVLDNVPNVVGQAVAIIIQIDRAPSLPAWPANVRWPFALAPSTFSTLGLDTFALLTLGDAVPANQFWTGSKVQEDCR
jgi:hypothetical protein